MQFTDSIEEASFATKIKVRKMKSKLHRHGLANVLNYAPENYAPCRGKMHKKVRHKRTRQLYERVRNK